MKSSPKPSAAEKVAFGAVLRELRENEGLTRHQLHEQAKVSTRAIDDIEVGRTWPNPSTLKRLAEALDTDVASIREKAKQHLSSRSQSNGAPPTAPRAVTRPSRRTVASPLSKQVHAFLRAMGYAPLGGDLHYHVGVAQPDHATRIRVRVLDGAATEADVAAADAHAAGGVPCFLISEFAPAASASHRATVHVFDLTGLIDHFLRLDAYTQWLEGLVLRQRLDERYVTLACAEQSVADVAVREWLNGEAREVFLVTGGFGTGKSWLVEHLAHEGLTGDTRAKEGRQPGPPLLLLVPLRDAGSDTRPEDVLAEFVRQHQLGVTYPALRLLAEWGRVAVLFDGLDELSRGHPSGGPWETLGRLTAELPPPAKVVVTCRSEHLRPVDPLANGRAEDGVVCRRITLGKLDDEHIRLIAARREAAEQAETIIRNEGLAELARRPLLLALLLDIPTAKLTGWRPTLAGAFAEIVRRKMQQDVTWEGAFLPHQRLGPLGDLAWVVLKSETYEWAESDLDQVATLYPESGTPDGAVKRWSEQVFGRTMFIPTPDGRFVPHHRSFMEFFAARKLVAELGVLKPEFVSLSEGGRTTRVPPRPWSDHRHVHPDEEVEGFRRETYPPDATAPKHPVGEHVARVGHLTRTALQFAAQMIDPARLDDLCEFARTFPGGDRWNALILLPLVAANDPSQTERIALALADGKPSMRSGVAWALGELRVTDEAVRGKVTDALKGMIDAVRTGQVSPEEYATAWWEAAFALEKITLGGTQNSQPGRIAIPLLTDALPDGYDLMQSLDRLEAAMSDESKRPGVEFDTVVLLKELGAAKNQWHRDRFLRLLPAVQEDTDERRWQYYLVWLVGRLKRPEAATVEFLVAATKSKLNSVRGIAYEALGQLVATSREHAAVALPVLCDGVRNDRYHRARAHAAAAIGELAGMLTTQQRTQAMYALSSALPVEEHKANEVVYHQSLGRLIEAPVPGE